MISGWFYLHLPLSMGIAAVGVAVFNVIEHTGEQLPSELRLLLGTAIGVSMISG